MRLTGLHNSGGSKNQNRTVGFGREFHADLFFWNWAIDHELLHEGEALSAPCYTAIQRHAQRHCLSDASFEEVCGFCVERKGIVEIRFSKRTDRRAKEKSRSMRDLYYHDQPARVVGHGRDRVGHA